MKIPSLNRTPQNFIVDLNNTPYALGLSPITAGSRKYQACLALPLGIISFFAGFLYLPIFTLLSVPLLSWAAFLLWTRHILSFEGAYVEIYSRTLLSEAKKEILIYQNYQGVQVTSRPAKAKKGAAAENFAITLVHSDTSLNLPLLDLPDGKRAYNLVQLYANMIDLPVLPARPYSSAKSSCPNTARA